MAEHYHCQVDANGIRSYGKHLLIDMWGARHLEDAATVEAAVRAAIVACGATLLNLFVQDFGVGSGVTAIAALSESHVSIHTWPETGYAALDIYTCGDCDPMKTLPVWKAAFHPRRMSIDTKTRGAEYTN
jgi:S-adenosylmethionine decarboxylase